jgi:hypothetical protein
LSRIRRCAAASALLACVGVSDAQPSHAEERGRRATEVVLLKRGGVTAYEEVAEEFGERCRVRARVVSFGDEGAGAARGRLGDGTLVVTVGQEAFDALGDANVRVIPTLAFHTPAGLLGPPAAPTPELLLKVLSTARGSVRTVGAVYGPRSESMVELARKAAEKLGITLRATRVQSGPEAVRALHALVDDQRTPIHAIWLPGDTDVITPQVFQYALMLQLERGLPLAAATRQQVHSGALIAVDFNPRAAGRAAANIANRMLEGRAVGEHDEVDLYGGARVTVNGEAARRLGINVAQLVRMGAKIE